MKVVLITGATSGIGQVSALELVRLGATVVLAGRDPQRCAETARRIQQDTGSQAVDWIDADLSTRSGVHQLSAEFLRRYDRLDVLLNNAGGFFMKRTLTPDGFEMTWALNHLSYFLLTHLLLETLKKSAPARVVNVSSGAHYSGRIDFDNLQGGRFFNGWNAYAQSKLANILFTYELARRLEGTRLTANALHPGFVATRFATNNGFLARLAMRLVRPFSLTPERGAQTSIYLASSPEVEGVSGKFFVQCKAVPSSPASYDLETARRLWEVSAKMTGLIPLPGSYTPPPVR